MKRILIFILILVNIYPKNIREIGFGPTEDEAKKEALAFLSQAIVVDVESSFHDKTKIIEDKVESIKEREVYLKSNLPLLGVLFTSEYKGDEYRVEAVLSTESIEVYKNELKKIKTEIEKLNEILPTLVEEEQKVNVLRAVLNKIDNYNRYYSVYLFLSGDEEEYTFFNKIDYELQLKKFEKKYDNLDYAVFNTFENFPYKNIFIYPPTEENFDEVSEFGAIIKYKTEDFLIKNVSPLEEAEYILKGTYEIFDNNILVQYRLIDLDGNIAENYLFQLEDKAYMDYEVKGRSNNFNKLLKEGYIVSSDFNINLQTSLGKKDLLFKKGDTFSLLVKSNRAAYFYLAGHTFYKKKKFSYLVDFNKAAGNRKFVYYIGPDEINRWVDLGEFEILPPYGVETLQIFASTQDIVDDIPNTVFDFSSNLYMLDNNPSKNLENMRAIAKKNRQLDEVTESYIIFTTIEK